jgi:hypothetical protein
MQPKLLQSVPTALEGDANLGERAPSFDEFYQDSFRRLFTALCLVTGDRHEAEEIAQDAFVRVFERWDRVGVHADPTGYLFRKRASAGLPEVQVVAPIGTRTSGGIVPELAGAPDHAFGEGASPRDAGASEGDNRGAESRLVVPGCAGSGSDRSEGAVASSR